MPSPSSSLPRDTPVAQLAGRDGPINAIRFTGDGKYCLTAGHDRTVRLWNPTRRDPSYPAVADPSSSLSSDLPRALPIQTYTDGHTHPVSSIATNPGPSASTLLSSSDRVLIVTDIVTRRVKRRFHGHAGRINDVSCALGGEAYLSGSYDGTVRVWDGRSRSNDPVQILDEAKDSVSAVEVVAEGARSSGAEAGVQEILTASVDGCLRTYDLRRGRIRVDDMGDSVTGVALTRDGQCVAASCLDGTIRLLERSTGELLQTYRGGHAAGRYGLGCDVSSDDTVVVSGSEDGAVTLYDLMGSGSAATAILRGHGKPTCAVASHPRREWKSIVLSASYDGRALVWASEDDAARWGG
mmetsp:Transcript_40112/g.120963  ORF Transcript_40112/g.120963 Transcript_40112/m.120963 type:complete len:353 (-) Transcript_40112:122-1180(-)